MLKEFIIGVASLLIIGVNGVTVTKTVHHVKTVHHTKTASCKPTWEVGKGMVSDTNNNDNNNDDNNTEDVIPLQPSTHQEECLALFNKFRRSINLPLLTSAPQAEIDCTNMAAVNDAARGYHNSFYGRLCPNASSQCECSKGVNGGGLKNCIDAYISEGPPGTIGMYPQEDHGHYKIIAGNFRQLACGTDDNGFFTHNFYF